MIAKDINPFIRYAFITSRKPSDQFVINADSRVFYVLEGNGKLTIGDKCYSFDKNFMGIWKSGTQYCWEFSDNSKIELAVINFDYTQNFRNKSEPLMMIIPGESSSENIIYCEDFEDLQLLNSPLLINKAQLFKQDILDIIKTHVSTAILSNELAESKLKELIIRTAQHITVNSKINAKLQPVLEYIHANYNKEISNTELGAIISYHPYHVNLLMKQHMGMTLHSYITQYRMNEALKMLANTNKSIESISIDTGYKNPTHFYKTFKKTYGISPSEYRKTTSLI